MTRGLCAGVALLVSIAVPAFAQDATPAPAVPAPPTGSLIAPALRVTDIARSTRFYTEGLGMVVGATLHHGTGTEVILGFGKPMHPALILLRDEAPGKSPPLEMGNGFTRVVMRMSDLDGLAARLKAAGYPVGEVQKSSVGPRILLIKDPDGYAYELVESPAPQP